jgi:hypothetical protein
MNRDEIVQRLTGQLHSLRFEDPTVARHKVKIILEEVIPTSRVTFALPDIVVPNLVSGSLAYPNMTPIQFQFQVIEVAS